MCILCYKKKKNINYIHLHSCQKIKSINYKINNIKYFNEVPSESNTFGLYDYIINGTEKAVSEIVKEL